ncbi:MAG: UvrD-helicase domain-containing protein [Anaerolineaceae bacterium]|nr:UvrD-helicase domain-containing protein [Anaerolineaceae bacterium]
MDPRSLLNEQQLDAVTVDGGATLVLAGPGSGKTRVLTHRIAYLIDQMGIPPYRILAVTFTNKAANEMKKRLESMVPERAQSVWLGTFHSICVKILRREARYLPVDSNFTIYDVDDQAALIKNILKDLNLNDKLYRPGAIRETISRAKNEMIMPKQYNIRTSRDAKIQEIYERYQASLRACNALDFDDLLLSALSLLYENDDVREKYASRFEHVLVDEFQDTNQIQYELVRLLSSVHKNLFVVGDEDQSIYRWRGADYRNVLRFEEDYGNFSKVLLEQNYRSTQKVLDLARSIIDQNRNRTPKALFTERGSGSLIRFYNAEDDRDEADYVVRTIRSEIKKGISPASYAIMYRMNSQSRMLEEAFMKAGIPYRLVGAQRFYGRREVKDVIAFLKLVHNPKDEVSIRRVINVPPRKIGDKSVDKLAEVARLTESSLGDVLQELGVLGSESEIWGALERSAASIYQFARLMVGWLEIKDKVSLPDLFDRILLDVEYQEYLQDGSEEEVIDRWGNVQELRRQAFEFEEQGLASLLENLALVSDQDTIAEKLDSPTLLTLHAAKGLEFDRVFIIGLDDGVLPHNRSFEDKEEMAEERRLFYVGITRARDQLYLVRAERRSMFGSYEMQFPSRFFKDVPDELVQMDSPQRSSTQRGYDRWERGSYRNGSGRSRRNHEDSFFESWDEKATSTHTWKSANSSRENRFGDAGHAAILPQRSDAPQREKKTEPTYKAGMKVKHPSFGEGIILIVRLEGDGEETLDIFFSELKQQKKLVASFVKLEIVSSQ